MRTQLGIWIVVRPCPLDGPGHDHGKSRRELVQCRAADGLVRLQVDGGKSQEEGENHAGSTRNQDGNQHGKLRIGRAESALIQCLEGEAGEQRTDDQSYLPVQC